MSGRLYLRPPLVTAALSYSLLHLYYLRRTHTILRASANISICPKQKSPADASGDAYSLYAMYCLNS